MRQAGFLLCVMNVPLFSDMLSMTPLVLTLETWRFMDKLEAVSKQGLFIAVLPTSLIFLYKCHQKSIVIPTSHAQGPLSQARWFNLSDGSEFSILQPSLLRSLAWEKAYMLEKTTKRNLLV